ncbi:hypothetical protein PSTG_17432 [Puccinia striiformis f. sp. tritici PST-78]|uniref:Uncharacterized protein n=1 Tax=Puccinia striiformis f. sp. tritici PST-78 TaxID=1165861 RepID=A0A0L0UQS4_9BASI|nr:hypothetical protein PSTG_17432 [Puccinia striiformis f. sp. tritici PST-78]
MSNDCCITRRTPSHRDPNYLVKDVPLLFCTPGNISTAGGIRSGVDRINTLGIKPLELSFNRGQDVWVFFESYQLDVRANPRPKRSGGHCDR